MSRFFPHTPYAEDQPLGRTILATHVAARAMTTGSIAGMAVVGARHLARRIKPKPPATAAVPASVRLLRSAGVGTVVALGLLSAGLTARMWGREQVEWQDRAWRLLENAGQVETDDWTVAGVVAGLAGAAGLRRGGVGSGSGSGVGLGWKGWTGAAGAGSVLGLGGYLAWRYGVHRGRFPARAVL